MTNPENWETKIKKMMMLSLKFLVPRDLAIIQPCAARFFSSKVGKETTGPKSSDAGKKKKVPAPPKPAPYEPFTLIPSPGI